MAGVDEGPAAATVAGSLDEGTALVSLGGELDIATVPGVEVELEPFVEGAQERIVFDLSAVTFMDSSGIAMLLRGTRRVKSFTVRNPSASVQMVIRATGLTEVLNVES